jgi:YVTN family beta-propeller protein
MKPHRWVSWLAAVPALAALLGCGLIPAIDRDSSVTPSATLPAEPGIPGTPTLQAIAPSPYRGLFPSDVEIAPDGARVYVPCYGSDNVLVIDTASHEVVDEVDLSEAGPSGLYAIDAVITPDGKKLYLADDFTGMIGVVDTSTNQVSSSIDVREWWPTGKSNRLAISPDGRFVYAAVESNQVPVIDVATDTVVDIIAFDSTVYLGAFSPDGSRAYVVGQPHGGTVYVVDTSTRTVVDRIDLGLEQQLQTQASMAVSPDGAEIYLTSGFNEGGYEHPETGINRVFVISVTGRSLVGEIEVDGGPHRMQLSPDGRLAYVSTADAEAVYVLDLASRTNIGRFDWDGIYAEPDFRFKRYDLRGIGFLPDGRSAYLAGWDGDVVILLDLLERRVTGAIELNPLGGAAPADVAIPPDGRVAYVTTSAELVEGASAGIVVIDTGDNTATRAIPIQPDPRRMQLAPDGSTIYVASDPVLVIDAGTDEVVASIFLGAGSTVHDVVLAPDQNKLYVSHGEKATSGGISVIDLSSNTVEKEIDVGQFPVTMVVTPDGRSIYVNRVLNPHDVGGLVIIDTATDQIVATIASPIDTPEEIGPIGAMTCGLAISPDGAYVYWTAGWQYINVVEVDSNTIVRTIEVEPALPGIHVAISSIGFLSDGSRAYIVCWDAGYVVVMDTRTWEFISIIRVGFRPGAIALAPDDSFAYVTNRHSEDVSVIDLATNAVVDTIQLEPPR